MLLPSIYDRLIALSGQLAANTGVFFPDAAARRHRKAPAGRTNGFSVRCRRGNARVQVGAVSPWTNSI